MPFPTSTLIYTKNLRMTHYIKMITKIKCNLHKMIYIERNAT